MRTLLAFAAAVLVALTVAVAAPAGAAAPACPAPAGNPRFVRFVYLEILDRCPDAGALAYWGKRLDDGMSRWSFAEAIDMSTENVQHRNVEVIYQGYLGRAPSAAELAAGVREIREELGCTVRVVGRLDGEEPVKPGYTLRVAVAELTHGEPVPHEHDAVRWLGPAELDLVAWLEPDLPFLDPLRRLLERTQEQTR